MEHIIPLCCSNDRQPLHSTAAFGERDLETNTLLFASYLAPNHRIAVICICTIHLVSSESLPRRIAPAKAFVHSSLSPSPSCPAPPLEPLGLW